jgi:hypothetical protein
VSIPHWRAAAGCLVLAGLVAFAACAGPIYVRNLQFHKSVAEIARSVENQKKPDPFLLAAVLEKARGLGLPVRADNVHITHSQDGLHIEVRYAVRLDLPLYTVALHFYPGAGSR